MSDPPPGLNVDRNLVQRLAPNNWMSMRGAHWQLVRKALQQCDHAFQGGELRQSIPRASASNDRD
eukprot:1161012-Pelagomonas_calceolata.AAC.7